MFVVLLSCNLSLAALYFFFMNRCQSAAQGTGNGIVYNPPFAEHQSRMLQCQWMGENVQKQLFIQGTSCTDPAPV